MTAIPLVDDSPGDAVGKRIPLGVSAALGQNRQNQVDPMNAPLALPALDAIRAHEDEMVAIHRQIHANPEMAYEEFATCDLVAERLTRWGYEVHRGLGGTGVVGA